MPCAVSCLIFPFAFSVLPFPYTSLPFQSAPFTFPLSASFNLLISQYLEDRARLERAIVQHVRALRDVFNGFHADTLDAQTLTETVIDAMPAALPSERLAEELRALVSLFPLRYEGWLLVGVAYFYEYRYEQAYAALEKDRKSVV